MLDAQDSGRAIAHALSALPERLRLPIELVYLDGHTHAEAAAALDWPKGTVDSYIRRGLARLKPILARTGIPAIALGAANLPMRAEAVPPDWIVRAVADAQRAAARPAAALSSWTVPLKIAGIVAAAGLAVSAGVAFWPASKRTPVSPPVAPNVPVVVESLPAANLRLLQSEIGPKVCEALKGITKDGQPPTILETEAYDSRVRVMIEACFRPKLPDVGEKSALRLLLRYRPAHDVSVLGSQQRRHLEAHQPRTSDHPSAGNRRQDHLVETDSRTDRGRESAR